MFWNDTNAPPPLAVTANFGRQIYKLGQKPMELYDTRLNFKLINGDPHFENQ